MPLERRVDAAGLFWDDEHSADQQMEAVAAIATHMKFRPRSVVTLAPEKRAKYLAQLPTVTDAIAARALVNYHLERAADDGPFLTCSHHARERPHQRRDLAKPDAERDAGGEVLPRSTRPRTWSLTLSTLVSQIPNLGAAVDVAEPPRRCGS